MKIYVVDNELLESLSKSGVIPSRQIIERFFSGKTEWSKGRDLKILTFGILQGKGWVPALLKAGSQPGLPRHTKLLMSFLEPHS